MKLRQWLGTFLTLALLVSFGFADMQPVYAQQPGQLYAANDGDDFRIPSRHQANHKKKKSKKQASKKKKKGKKVAKNKHSKHGRKLASKHKKKSKKSKHAKKKHHSDY